MNRHNNYANRPKMGDWVHFFKICAACNNVGSHHFTFTIDDWDLLAILPNFPKRLHTYAEGQKIDMWWDHSPSTMDLYKVKFGGLKNTFAGIFRIPQKHGFEDTYLIILGDNGFASLTGPSRNIVPLTHERTSDPLVLQIVSRMDITHFNYVDFRTQASMS